MGELDPERAWLWLEHHRQHTHSETNLKKIVGEEWAFRDPDGLFEFLKTRKDDIELNGFFELKWLLPGSPEEWMKKQYEFQEDKKWRAWGEGRLQYCVTSLQDGRECSRALSEWQIRSQEFGGNDR